MTVFLGDFYAVHNNYKAAYAEGLPYLAKTRSATVDFPEITPSRFPCAAVAAFQLAANTFRVLATTPQGRAAIAIVDSFPDDGIFDRSVFITIAYALQLDDSTEGLDPKPPDEAKTLLRSDEAKSVELVVKNWLGVFPIEAIWAELEFEFVHATHAITPEGPASVPVETPSNIPGGTSANTAKRTRAPRATDPAMEARNRWIYEECCKHVPYDTIALRLKKKPKAWERIDSKQGIRAVAVRYAKRHNLPEIPARQDP